MTGLYGGTGLHLAVALDGAGWHPAAWRAPDARPDELFTARYWAGLAREAERGLLDFVTIEDALTPRPAGRSQGGLDAVLVAARLAPVTGHIGLVPTTDVTHTEPFHVSIGVASLDFASYGRAGWRPRVSAGVGEAGHFGRRRPSAGAPPGRLASDAELYAEAADAAEVVRRLWDSWEDGAEIRDAATGRFLDRDRLHYIDFEGPYFSVRGPSITPRPPQGQPVVTVLADTAPAYEFAARSADVVYLTPDSRAGTGAAVSRVRAAEAAAGRRGEPLRVFADLLVFVDDRPGAAAVRKARLDELDGAGPPAPVEVFTGTPAELADLLEERRDAGLTGFRLRPGVLPHDLTGITRRLVPELQRRGAFRTAYRETTLRARLGLARPAGRYRAPAAATTGGRA
ncbi:LLM class flavin-dependent oxidoreductase [Actinomadura chibensis]|uniref:LLM class flavin-dependent oxidoreductase n=1 Tax=Actinomadura chibensis TaxID=392828 RepID=A0A5D0NI63_9ACTN|nr:LLM class flavin-dependent oxidoreductase [Actinomadura chibensis]TYB44126.1 LLM class flavin-dependent oxidoreductase [Actinomadura chibensis]